MERDDVSCKIMIYEGEKEGEGEKREGGGERQRDDDKKR